MTSQQAATRLAGFLYLLTNATAIFAFTIRGRLIAYGDAAETARRITAVFWRLVEHIVLAVAALSELAVLRLLKTDSKELGIFEIGGGAWLLFKGMRVPDQQRG